MEYKTRQWHEKCFSCCVCQGPIGTKSFIPREQEIYCTGCYEEKFATRCIKCDKVSLDRRLLKIPHLRECDSDGLVDKGCGFGLVSALVDVQNMRNRCLIWVVECLH